MDTTNETIGTTNETTEIMSEAMDKSFVFADLGWGFLAQNLGRGRANHNLRANDRSAKALATIKTRFSKHFLDDSKPIDYWMREIYQQCFLPAQEEKQAVEQIGHNLEEQIRKIFTPCWNNEPGINPKNTVEGVENLCSVFLREMGNLIFLRRPEMISDMFDTMHSSGYKSIISDLWQRVWISCQRDEPR